MITELEFKSLSAQGYNRIPLIAEAFADLETPLSLYLKLAYASGGGKHSFLLESVVGGERIGRYHETRDFPAVRGPSYLSLNPTKHVERTLAAVAQWQKDNPRVR